MKTLNDTMSVDYYEFTMGNTFFQTNVQDTEVVFDIFFRKNPFDGGFTITGGLDNIIDFIQKYNFTNHDIEFLKENIDFDKEYLKNVKNTKFTGDIYSVPDGTMVFPNEPVITVKAPINQAVLLEAALLAYFNFGSLVTTKTKRITKAADGKSVSDMGLRRGRGTSSAYEAGKYAIVGGCNGTSNTKLAKEMGIKAIGTVAHLLIQFFENDVKAFTNFALSNPNNCIFLVDTYNVLESGIPAAIWVADNILKPRGIEFKGIRIDSGDLVELSKKARIMLDEAGYKDAKICLSNGLDEYKITKLLREGAQVDSFGVGDNISACNDIVGAVYKLAAVKENGIFDPRIKVSEDPGKTTNPGYKKLYRLYDNETGLAVCDVVALADEEVKVDNYTVRPLQVPIFKQGRLVYRKRPIAERADYCEEEYNTISPEVTDIFNPEKYNVLLSEQLDELKTKMIEEHTSKKGRVKTYARRKN